MIGVWIAAALALGPAVAAQTPKKPKPSAEAPKKKPAKKASSWTGCVDQRAEYFYLTDDREMKPIARLEGDDPERASYAKYLGQKVTVTGVAGASSEEGIPSIQVKEIKKVSDVCTSEGGGAEKKQ